MSIRRSREDSQDMYHNGDIFNQRWTRQVNAENGGVVSTIWDRGITEKKLIMSQGRYKIGLFLIPFLGNYNKMSDARLTKFSVYLDQAFYDAAANEGYSSTETLKKLSIEESKDALKLLKVEQELGVKITEDGVAKYFYEKGQKNLQYLPTIDVIAPSTNSLSELGKLLQNRLGIVKDIAEDQGVSISPISVPYKRKLKVPFYISGFNPFKSDKEEDEFVSKVSLEKTRVDRLTWFSLNQAARNSVCLEEPALCEDYATYCSLGELEDNLRYENGAEHLCMGAVPAAYSGMIDKVLSFIKGSAYLVSERPFHSGRLPIEVNWALLSEKAMGKFFAHSDTYPSSIDETIALASLNHAIDNELAKRLYSGEGFSLLPFWFQPPVFVDEFNSRVYDSDPEVIIIDSRVVEDLGDFNSALVSNSMARYGKEKELIQKLVRDGYAEVTTVSRFWPKLMKELQPSFTELGVTDGILDIIKNDLGTKFGSRRIKRYLSEGMKYEDVIEDSWESLYKNERWIE